MAENFPNLRKDMGPQTGKSYNVSCEVKTLPDRKHRSSTKQLRNHVIIMNNLRLNKFETDIKFVFYCCCNKSPKI